MKGDNTNLVHYTDIRGVLIERHRSTLGSKHKFYLQIRQRYDIFFLFVCLLCTHIKRVVDKYLENSEREDTTFYWEIHGIIILNSKWHLVWILNG